MLVAFQSCSLFSETPSKDAFVGGEIVNPLSTQVIIEKNSKVIDSVVLDSENKFSYYIKNVEPGIYTLSHGPEDQILFLEPGDSTMIFANTINFDESLHFSGHGAEKNNFLIEMYLLNERNNELVLSVSGLEPEKMESFTDSIRKARKMDLEKLKEKHRFSPEFMKLASKSIDYEFYDLRERYSFLINKYNKKFISRFPASFHDYRSEINFSNTEFEDYYGYSRLIDNYLKNKSVEHCKTSDCYDLFAYNNIKLRLHLIDSLTKNPKLKNTYFCRLGAQGILSAENPDQVNSIIELLKKEGFPKSKMANMKMLGAIQNVYFPGKKLPSISMTDVNGKSILLPKLVEQPTIFYNWSIHFSEHHKEQHEQITELKKKYPEIKFIGLNVDPGETEQWLNVMKEHNYIIQEEYQLPKLSINKKLLRNFLDKMLVVDEKGIVVMGDLTIDSPDFHQKVKQFLNNKNKLLAFSLQE